MDAAGRFRRLGGAKWRPKGLTKTRTGPNIGRIRRVVYDRYRRETKEAEMNINIEAAIGYCWVSVAMVWLIGLASTKRAVRRQKMAARLFYIALLLLGFFLIGNSHFDIGWLGRRLIPGSEPTAMFGLALTAAGCLFAIWARITLGSNWSGRPTVKEGHELVVRGPYALARHPIYTGLLLAAVGTALGTDRTRCVLGLVLIAIGFMIKMSQEERLMMQTFPEAYPAYRARVKALIPGVL